MNAMANPNPATLNINPIVQVTEIPGRGRAIVATRDVRAGEILLTDSPILLYPANPFKHHFCSNCFKRLNTSPLTCPGCPNLTSFCSPTCQSTALSSSHSPWVCQALTSIHHSFSTSLDADDVSDAHFLIAAYNLGATSPDRFKLLLSLEGAVSAPDPRTLAIHSLISSLSPPQTVIGVGFSLELSAALLAKDKRNAFALMEPFEGNGERNVRAYGIYPNAAFFNHDCLPNATRFDYVDGSGDGSGHNTDMIVRAIHDFPRGREVCLSYFPVNWNYADRQKRLKEDYGFVCDCDRCKVEVNWKDDNDNENDNDDNMEEMEDEQMMGSDEESGQEENDFPHAYFFVKYVCDRDGCGGTLAPLPPSEGASSDVLECNVCGKLRTGEEADGVEGEDGTMEDD